MTLSLLSDDYLLPICSYLSPYELVQFGRCDRRFQRFHSEDRLWTVFIDNLRDLPVFKIRRVNERLVEAVASFTCLTGLSKPENSTFFKEAKAAFVIFVTTFHRLPPQSRNEFVSRAMMHQGLTLIPFQFSQLGLYTNFRRLTEAASSRQFWPVVLESSKKIPDEEMNTIRGEVVSLAALHGRLDVVQSLLANASLSLEEYEEALHKACICSDHAMSLGVVQFLLQKVAGEGKKISMEKRSQSLEGACGEGHFQVVELLLQDGSVSEYSRGRSVTFAVKKSDEADRARIVSRLLRMGNITILNFEDAVDISVIFGCSEILQVLVESNPIGIQLAAELVIVNFRLEGAQQIVFSGTPFAEEIRLAAIQHAKTHRPDFLPLLDKDK